MLFTLQGEVTGLKDFSRDLSISRFLPDLCDLKFVILAPSLGSKISLILLNMIEVFELNTLYSASNLARLEPGSPFFMYDNRKIRIAHTMDIPWECQREMLFIFNPDNSL